MGKICEKEVITRVTTHHALVKKSVIYNILIKYKGYKNYLK